jgi:methionyl-tRNA formyltransferase
VSYKNLQRFRACLIGADSLLLECGDILRERGHEIVAVISDAERVQRWAGERGLRGLGLHEYLEALRDESFEYLFAITHLAILPEAALGLPTRAAINFHDGPLPRYAGLNAPAWALMAGEREYGISFHEIKGGIDEGDLLKQKRFELLPDETSLSLNTRNFGLAIEAFGELVDELAEDKVVRTRQDLSARSYFGKHARPAAGCVIDLAQPANSLSRLIRALDFGAYANPLGLPKLVHQGKALLVRAAELGDAWSRYV